MSWLLFDPVAHLSCSGFFGRKWSVKSPFGQNVASTTPTTNRCSVPQLYRKVWRFIQFWSLLSKWPEGSAVFFLLLYNKTTLPDFYIDAFIQSDLQVQQNLVQMHNFLNRADSNTTVAKLNVYQLLRFKLKPHVQDGLELVLLCCHRCKKQAMNEMQKSTWSAMNISSI